MARQMSKRFICIDCGAPAFRRGVRCPSCAVIHKRAYSRARNHPERTTPAPRPQRDLDLPPYGQMVIDDEGEHVRCHACGRWLGSLVTHIKTHGLDTDRYREQYDIARTTPLVAPSVSRKLRDNAMKQELHKLSVPLELGTTIGRQRGTTNRLQSRITISRSKDRP